MAELLIRVVEEPGRLRGTVVTVQRDGWPWSHTERTSPVWRIVSSPDWALDDTVRVMATQQPNRVVAPDDARRRLLHRRACVLDLDAHADLAAHSRELRTSIVLQIPAEALRHVIRTVPYDAQIESAFL